MDTKLPDKRRNTQLRFALDDLGPIRNDPDSNALRRLRATNQALLVINEDNAIVSGSSIETFQVIGATWAFDPTSRRLSNELEAVVRSARTEWFPDDDAADVITIHRGKHVMLISRLRGFGGKQMVISFQALQRRATLRDGALRYDLTPREYDVLRFALGGFSAAEIAAQLAIAETTAQVYLKRLLQKTNSRNRAQMVATVLGSRMSQDFEGPRGDRRLAGTDRPLNDRDGKAEGPHIGANNSDAQAADAAGGRPGRRCFRFVGRPPRGHDSRHFPIRAVMGDDRRALGRISRSVRGVRGSDRCALWRI